MAFDETDPGYDPTTDPDYNPNGGTGGQTGGGGGPAGGRDDGGKPSGGEQTGGSQTTLKGYLDPKNITSAATEVCAQLTKEEGKYKAICNLSVHRMFENLVGPLPSGMRVKANKMTKYWIQHPEQWQPISLSQAQDYANKGYFVVVGWINPIEGESGHVMVVVPGEMEYSGAWGKKVPVVLEMGKGRRYAKTKMSWGVDAKKEKELKVFYYKKEEK